MKRSNAVEFWPTVKAGEHQAVVLNDTKTAWVLIADYRGVTYWDESGQRHEIKELGLTVPETASLTPPEPEPDPDPDPDPEINTNE